MENRFGIKDLFLFLLVVLLIILIALAMKQYDRQYQDIRELRKQGQDQLNTLIAIQRDLERGITFGAATPGNESSQEIAEAFPELSKLRAAGKYNEGDWLVENFESQVAKITPLINTDIYSSIVQSRVLETLVYQDPDTLKYLPLLATHWDIKDNTAAWQSYIDKRKRVPITEPEITSESDCPPASDAAARRRYVAMRMKQGRREDDIGNEPACPPASTIDFKLRQGVTFSDGSPFSADDVIFTFDWIKNPKVDAPRDRQGLAIVKSVQKISDNEVLFTFNQPNYQSFANVATEGVLSKRFYSRYTPDQFNASVGLLIGTGPYRMDTPDGWKPSPGKIELFRNQRYWGLSPSFDRIVYYQIESEVTTLVMYGNGELDIDPLTPEQYRLQQRNPDQMLDRSHQEIYLSGLTGYSYIGWNESRKLFADKRLRQAMTMLTDRQGICKNILLGFAQPAPGPFSTNSKQHDPELVDWKYDPQAAKALLKELGFADRGSGVLSLADGTQLSFKLTYPAKSPLIDRMMQYIRDDYGRAGVNMILDPVDFTILEQRLKNHNFDAVSLGWGGGSMESDIYQMFDSSQIADQGDDFISYADPKLDEAIEQARRTLNEDERMKLWQKCERILHEDQPYTFLINSKAIVLFDKRIQNVHQAKTGLNYVAEWNMPVPWYVPVALQKYK